jgi:hypothetical protein
LDVDIHEEDDLDDGLSVLEEVDVLSSASESEEESVVYLTVSLFGGTSYVRMYLSMSKASDHYIYLRTLSTYTYVPYLPT